MCTRQLAYSVPSNTGTQSKSKHKHSWPLDALQLDQHIFLSLDLQEPDLNNAAKKYSLQEEACCF